MQNRNRQQQRQGTGFTQGFNEGFSGRQQSQRGQQLRHDMQDSQSYGDTYRDHMDEDSDYSYSPGSRPSRWDAQDYHAERLTNGFNTQSGRFDSDRSSSARGYDTDRFDRSSSRGYEADRFDRSERSARPGSSWGSQSYNYNDDMNRSENWGRTDRQGAMGVSNDLSGRYSQDQVGRYQSNQPWQGAKSASTSWDSSPSSQYQGTRHDQWQTEARHAGKGPKGFKRSDERIKEEVCEALEHHAGVDASEIDVTLKDGIITLSGTIESRQMKRLAEECVEGIRGVQDVKNDLRVDTTIASKGHTYGSESDTTEATSRNSSLNGKNQIGGRSSSNASSTSSVSKQ